MSVPPVLPVEAVAKISLLPGLLSWEIVLRMQRRGQRKMKTRGPCSESRKNRPSTCSLSTCHGVFNFLFSVSLRKKK
jgi:hypothetical protein